MRSGRRALPSAAAPTPSGTRSRPISWKTAMTSEPSRNSSGTGTCPQPCWADGGTRSFRLRRGGDVTQPPLRLLHSEAILSRVKLDQFRRLSTAELIELLALGRPGALKARPDGTVLDGHHRIVVLRERGVSVDTLPREVVPHEVGE